MYKIMSTNVLGKYPRHSAEDAITESRMKTLAECISFFAPDSVGVQEYGSQNQIFLPKYLPEKYTFVDFGQTWISTFYDSERLLPIKTVCKRLSTSSNQGYRFTAVVFAHKADGSLAYIHGNLHLEYKDKETRLINAEEVNAAIRELFAENEEYKALPLVITGDYNARADLESAVFETIAGDYNIKDSVSVAENAEGECGTFHPVGVPVMSGTAVDHVLVNCDTVRVLTQNIIKEDDYSGILDASDHYPLLIEFSPI